MSKIKEKICFLRDYYYINRGLGNTYSMMKGAENTECQVLMNYQDFFNRLKLDYDTSNISPVTLGNLDRLRGSHKPLMIDNDALIELFSQAANEMSRLEKENDKLNIDNDLLRGKIREAKRVLL